MAQQTVRMSPQYYARLCGVLYLYIIVAGMCRTLRPGETHRIN